MPFGPRGLITIPASKPFPIGVIEKKDLLSGCLLPTCLSRDLRPCVRSISWSPIGFASNSGCLLAVCTTEGCVKLYRMPFCEFSAEWVEVMDISEMLYNYLASIRFGELGVPSSEFSDEQASQLYIEHGHVDDLPISVLRKKYKRRRQNALAVINKDSGTLGDQSSCSGNNRDANPGSTGKLITAFKEVAVFPHEGSSVEGVEIISDNLKENNLHQIVSVPNTKVKPLKKIPVKCNLPLITADQYASRSAMLSSLVVAWSPILQLTSGIGPVLPNNLPNCCSLLAVGGKSGKISFWRILEPQCYSVMHSRDPTAGLLVGLLQAHNTWITTIGWALYMSDALNSQLLLATGSSDGSVKIWLGHSGELLKSSEVNHAPFSLLKEVITCDSVPVSVLSLIVPRQSSRKMLLAVGKGSGSFEVWICNISANKFDRAGSYDAHDHIVTGLAWAFDGCCLYSCSQDNSVRSWILQGNSLCEVPIPSNTLGVKSSTDVPNVFDSCFGLAVSPGNLVLVVARSFDADLLNPMYQVRTQKAAVEFFWIGGQQLNNSYDRYPEFEVEAYPGFPEKELVYWEHNFLWSLNQYEHLDKPLVVWDVIAALMAFKQSSPKYVEHILNKWLVSYLGSQLGLSTAKILSHASRFLSNITSRQLHLLNIISRRLVLTKLKADKINSKQQNLEGLCDAEEELPLWMELLLSSERELRERLVGFSFSVVLSLVSHSLTNYCKFGYWHPVGLAQMEQWVSLNHDHLQDHLKLLASEVGKLDKSRLSSRCEYAAEEHCSYCSASVPFESTEAAFCRGVKCDDGVGQSHKLGRCAVSMQVCPTTPLWFCVCCQRWASKLAPHTLFTMSKYPSDIKSSTDSSTLEVFTIPFCPFCGILLQRLQPEFLLSASPV
uniref:Transcription factor IIIC 90kDa subunit N-terminal domain-containing protein n=2 Tax=Davidia involucrata TaxID=16924 RepID=A0A5B6YNM7_DAVIN